MTVKNMISPGIGFSPGSVQFIVTRGLYTSAAPTVIVAFTTVIQKTVAFTTVIQKTVAFTTEVS